jgi:hypothetical protein
VRAACPALLDEPNVRDAFARFTLPQLLAFIAVADGIVSASTDQWMTVMTFKTDGNHRCNCINTIAVGKADATSHFAPQNHQLTSEHGILCLKPDLRLEWRDQDGQDKI